ncbi:hypothetical protein B0J14DRAFT_575512 [Halenospora varia]|nr:hypothetical protein B0J14DRAFT_575512 [Halenospora varia]
MNWTGGRLQRHSGSAGTLKNKQQQHFARVKANLLNGRKKSPAKGSLLGKGLDSFAENHRQTSTLNSTSRRQRSHSDIRWSPERRQVNLDLRANLLDNAHRRSESQRRDSRALTKRERVPEDDLYSATPPPLGAKRERHISISDDDDVQSEEEETLSQKRRKILRKGDWVSVGFQQPPRLTFTSPRKADNVGRRRKITDRERAQYAGKMQAKIASPFVTRHIAANGDHHETSRLGNADVRISIGGRVVPPGVSSSSAHSKRLSLSSLIPVSNRAPSQSSDVMLLDNEGPFSSLVAYSDSQTQRIFESARHIDNLPNPDFWKQSTPHTRRVPKDDVLENERNNGKVQVASTEAYATPNQLPFPGNTVDSHIVENEQLPFQSNVDAMNTPPQPIFSSSSASILHPKPQSSKISPLLRTNHPEIADSTVAQVGVSEPVVPSSQAVDNEIWETWMEAIYPENDLGGPINTNQDSNNEAFSTSPGVSAAPGVGAPAIDEGTSILSDDMARADSSEPSRDYEEVDTGTSTYLEVLASADASVEAEASTIASQPEANMAELIEERPESRLSASRLSSLSPLSVNSFKHPGNVPDENYEKSRPTTESSQASSQCEDVMAEYRIERSKATVGASVQQKKVESEDPDEVWRNFVFGSEDDEVDVLQDIRPFLSKRSGIRESSGLLPVPQPVWDTLPKEHYFQRYEEPSGFSTITQHSTISFSTRSSIPFGFGSENEMSNCIEQDSLAAEASAYNSTNDEMAMHASEESGYTWGSESGMATVGMTVAPQSSSSPRTIDTPSHKPRKRVLFTKPKRFVGRASGSNSYSDRDNLYISAKVCWKMPKDREEESAGRRNHLV